MNDEKSNVLTIAEFEALAQNLNRESLLPVDQARSNNKRLRSKNSHRKFERACDYANGAGWAIYRIRVAYRKQNVGNPLTFIELRTANLKRLKIFKNSNGEPAHSELDGSDWSAADWLTATMGELGEAANNIKKVRRGDFTLEESREKISHELADTIIYLDLLANRLGIDLEQAVTKKWNLVSERIGSSLRIGES